jgi:hypothetical protein
LKKAPFWEPFSTNALLFVFHPLIQPGIHFPKHVEDVFPGSVSMAFKGQENQSGFSPVAFDGLK